MQREGHREIGFGESPLPAFAAVRSGGGAGSLKQPLIAAAFGVVVALVVSEAVVRVLGLDQPASEASLTGWRAEQRRWRAAVYRDDPEIGHVPKPGVEITIQDEAGEPVVFRTDSRGIRRGERPADESGTVLAVLGDSFVQAARTPFDESFCAILASKLEDTAVLNLGVGGYGNFQAVGWARRVLEGQKVDRLILGVFAGNDLRDNRLWLARRQAQTRGRSPNLLRRTALWRVFSARLGRGAHGKRLGGRYDWRSYFDAELMLYDPALDDLDRVGLEEAKQVTTQALTEFLALADELGAHAMVMFIPTKAMVYEEPSFITGIEATPWAKESLDRVGRRGFDFGANRGIWQEMFEEIGLDYLDLTDEFRAHRERRLYGLIDRHWNSNGQEVAASATVGYLSSARRAPGEP